MPVALTMAWIIHDHGHGGLLICRMWRAAVSPAGAGGQRGDIPSQGDIPNDDLNIGHKGYIATTVLWYCPGLTRGASLATVSGLNLCHRQDRLHQSSPPLFWKQKELNAM